MLKKRSAKIIILFILISLIFNSLCFGQTSINNGILTNGNLQNIGQIPVLPSNLNQQLQDTQQQLTTDQSLPNDSQNKPVEETSASEEKDKFSTLEKYFNRELIDQADQSGTAAPAEKNDEARALTSAKFQRIYQFGYDIFNQTIANFMPSGNVPIGSDYIIGPGDVFNITMWGINEGVFKVTVNQNGEIVLPKAGVVSVAGLPFGQLQPFIEKYLNRFYEGINLAVTSDSLKNMRIYVVGEVKQPGSYYISSISTLFNALFSAGGPAKSGSLRNIQLIRKGQVIAHIDLYKFLMNGDKSQDLSLQAEDTVFVPLIGKVVALAGEVKRPGIYEFNGKADLMDALWLAGGLTPNGYSGKIQINRIVANQKKLLLDRKVFFSGNEEKVNIQLADRDLIEISAIYPKVDNYINVYGNVKYPGKYEYTKGKKLKDILNQDMLFSFNRPAKIEIARISDETDEIMIFQLDYADLLKNSNGSGDFLLREKDEISVLISSMNFNKVSIKGEVRFPGTYYLRPEEKLSSLLERAGGYTEDAFLLGARLIRSSVKEIQEASNMKLTQLFEKDLLKKEIELDWGIMTPEDASKRMSAYEKSRGMLSFLTAETSGRVIVHLDMLDKLKNSKNDIELENEDEIFIPKTSKVVMIMGAVYNPNSISYEEKLKVKDYLDRVGGITENADISSIYILRADGSVVSRQQRYDLASMRLFPGDTVLVPVKLEKYTLINFMKDISRWLYEMVVSVTIVQNLFK